MGCYLRSGPREQILTDWIQWSKNSVRDIHAVCRILVTENSRSGIFDWTFCMLGDIMCLVNIDLVCCILKVAIKRCAGHIWLHRHIISLPHMWGTPTTPEHTLPVRSFVHHVQIIERWWGKSGKFADHSNDFLLWTRLTHNRLMRRDMCTSSITLCVT